jgi:hypothetical protein
MLPSLRQATRSKFAADCLSAIGATKAQACFFLDIIDRQKPTANSPKPAITFRIIGFGILTVSASTRL